ncbi:histone deacetylase 8-like [Ostrinia nubilalis]|uniref:histone deacetylase 8-like n=1 Tax=Ostrinia nubilalis TaxID=29057 RepID=UPI0030823FA1
MKEKVCYIWDEDLIDQCNRLPAVCGRASMVHDLIVSYDLNKHMKVIRSSAATYEDLKKFHSELYIDYLKSLVDIDEDYMPNAVDEEYGIGYDCPPVSNMYELVSVIAGGSVTAAKSLVIGAAEVAINWCGGWHHAQRSAADGFCYVNDIVLAIETLKSKYPKVLYIDLDVHHGNGVQDAYCLNKNVLTLSFHKLEPGFYPGTGNIDDIGSLTGKGYSCNFPFSAWYSNDTIEYVFQNVFSSVFDKFLPDAVVVQCGADALARDPQGGGNLTARGYCACVTAVLDKRKPTLLLGGGGYNYANAARVWTSITALVVGETLDENIPEHSHWTKYGPDYMLAVEPMLARDTNKKNHLDKCIAEIRDNLQKYVKPSKFQERMLKRKIDTGAHHEQNDEKSCDNVNLNSKSISKDKDSAKLPKTVSSDVYDFID